MSNTAAGGDGESLFGWFMFWVIAVAGALYFFDVEFAIKTWQVFSHSVGYNQVQLQAKPHDCSFMSAPLGAKNCHYTKEVETVLWKQDPPGTSLRSIDSGRTWEPHTPGKCEFDLSLSCPNVFDPPGNVAPVYKKVFGVVVSWNKVDD